MNALELKKILEEYSDRELGALSVRVFANMDISEGDTIIADSAEVTEWELLIEV